MLSFSATQVLNFFQTSKRILYWSSLLALVLALLSFPIWHQIFTEHNLPVQIRMAAPGVEYVRVYWDNPKHHPTAYERIPVNPVSSQLWQVKVESLAKKNPQSKGAEVWILDISTPEGRVDWSKAVMGAGKWELREDPNGPQGKVAIAHSSKPQSLIVPITGSDLTINLLRHPWSGKTRITVNNQAHEVDLFAEEHEVETLTFLSTKLGDELVRSYEIKAVNTPWHRLKFVAENGGEVEVEQVKVKKRTITTQRYNEFILPFKFWNRFSYTLALMLISFLLMTSLFVSAAHLWQGKPHKLFGVWSFTITLSVTLGSFWMLIFYPGNMSVDSIDAWKQSLIGEYNNWQPPIMLLLMRLIAVTFGNQVQYYSLLQGILFYLSVFLLLKQLCFNAQNQVSSKTYVIASLIMAIYPVAWVYSVTLWKDVWLAIFSCLLATYILIFIQNYSYHYLFLVSVFLGFSIAVRHNSIFILFGVIVSFLILFRKIKMNRLKKTIILLILTSSLLYAPLLEHISKATKSNVFPVQFSALTLGYMRQYYEDSTVIDSNAQRFIDQSLGTGATKDFISMNYSCGSEWTFLFSKKSYSKLGQLVNVSESIDFGIKGLIFRFFISHPISVVKHHFCVIDKMINLSTLNNTYWYHIGVVKNNIGISQMAKDNKLLTITSSILRFTYKWGLSKHWFFILVLLIMAANTIKENPLQRWLRHYGFSSEAIICLTSIGISYFLSLCLVPVAVDWRYLFPTTLISVILIVSLIAKCLSNALINSKRFLLVK